MSPPPFAATYGSIHRSRGTRFRCNALYVVHVALAPKVCQAATYSAAAPSAAFRFALALKYAYFSASVISSTRFLLFDSSLLTRSSLLAGA